jgi:hypothetical protein
MTPAACCAVGMVNLLLYRFMVFGLLSFTLLELAILNDDSSENMTSIHCFLVQLKPFHLHLVSEKRLFSRLASRHIQPLVQRFLDIADCHIKNSQTGTSFFSSIAVLIGNCCT